MTFDTFCIMCVYIDIEFFYGNSWHWINCRSQNIGQAVQNVMNKIGTLQPDEVITFSDICTPDKIDRISAMIIFESVLGK